MAEQEPDRGKSESAGLTLEAYYRESGLGFGGGDIFCIGGGSIAARVGELILLLLSFHVDGGQSRLSQIVVIAPPGSASELKRLEAKLNNGVEKGELRPPASVQASERFRFIELPDLRSASVIAEVKDIAEKSAIIIHDAAAFRNADGKLEPDKPGLREDFWVPQVHSLCAELLAATRGKNAYVVLDTGELVLCH